MAEDLLSDVFLDVWRQAERFEGRASVSTWLLGDRPLQGALGDAAPAGCGARRRGRGHGRDPADDPEFVLQKKDRGELLRQSLARLSPEHGEVIDLVYYHGKSVKEVAKIVGVAEATVKTRMFYARKKLAELVEAA